MVRCAVAYFMHTKFGITQRDLGDVVKLRMGISAEPDFIFWNGKQSRMVLRFHIFKQAWKAALIAATRVEFQEKNDNLETIMAKIKADRGTDAKGLFVSSV